MKKIAVVILLGVFFAACNSNIGTSGTFLVINSFTPETVTSDVDSISSDNVYMEITANMRNLLEWPTAMCNAVVDQIDVEYSRLNSNNVQGKDIPFNFSVQCNTVVEIDGVELIGIEIIRAVAKLEPPLIDLAYLDQEKVLYLTGKITVHAHDVGGHRLAPVVAYIPIECANFGS